MKTIHIARLGKMTADWTPWLQGLVNAGFEIREINPMSLELQTVFANPGDVVLLDGMLPYLRNFLNNTCSRCPEAHLVVLSEEYNFTIYYEVMNHGGASYFYGPANTDLFLESIQNLVSEGENSGHKELHLKQPAA